MEKSQIFIGADVSKLSIDFTALIAGEARHQKVSNTRRSIRSYFEAIKSELQADESSFIIGIENTGRYCWASLEVFAQSDVKLFLLSPLHVKKSLGMVRGKNDAIDSERIAHFMRKNVDELPVYQSPRRVVGELGLLLARRGKIQRYISAEKVTKEELCAVSTSEVRSAILNDSKSLITVLKRRLEKIEKAIEKLIASDQQLNEKVKLTMSVPGVGKVLSWYLLVKTNEFKNFSDPRKLACYAGVAPFEYSSGTSIRGKTRVSFFADKKLKKILHLAALRVTQLKGELREFYLRKVAEGKNKMLVINALRNKIIHRIMAVINQNRPYQKEYKNHLDMS